jgi:protoporphyrinogen/coproporphyrinogen III oxidase
MLLSIEYASVALVNLSYPPVEWSPPPGSSGLLVPSAEGRTIAGCTWTSVKWPLLAPPDGGMLVRAFVGRAGRDPALDLDDAELVRRVTADLREMARLEAEPRAWKVTRWDRAIPQYAVGHGERIERIESALADHPGIALAGAGYRGSGLPDCIRQAEEAAQRLSRALSSRA